MKLISGVAALATIGGALFASAAPANASTQGCAEVGHIYYSTSEVGTYRGDRGTRTYGRSGGTVTIALGRSVTSGGSITGTASAEVKIIFAKASAHVGITIHKDWTSSVTRSYSWKVPSSQKTGWIEAGHRGYKITYRKWTFDSPCKYRLLKTGKVIGNTRNIEFTHS